MIPQTEVDLFRSLKKTAIVLLIMIRLDKPCGRNELASILDMDQRTIAAHLRSLAFRQLITRTKFHDGYIPTQLGRQLVLGSPEVLPSKAPQALAAPKDLEPEAPKDLPLEAPQARKAPYQHSFLDDNTADDIREADSKVDILCTVSPNDDTKCVIIDQKVHKMSTFAESESESVNLNLLKDSITDSDSDSDTKCPPLQTAAILAATRLLFSRPVFGFWD